jgi:hypothetical protein
MMINGMEIRMAMGGREKGTTTGTRTGMVEGGRTRTAVMAGSTRRTTMGGRAATGTMMMSTEGPETATTAMGIHILVLLAAETALTVTETVPMMTMIATPLGNWSLPIQILFLILCKIYSSA